MTGEVYLLNDKVQQAYAILLTGLAKHPTSLIWHFVVLGRTAEALYGTATAREWYDRALALDNTDPASNLYIGVLLVNLGQGQEAIHHL